MPAAAAATEYSVPPVATDPDGQPTAPYLEPDGSRRQ
jgi:hypothetical protein